MTTDRPAEKKTVKIPVERMADLIAKPANECRACGGEGTLADLDASELETAPRVPCNCCNGTGYTH